MLLKRNLSRTVAASFKAGPWKSASMDSRLPLTSTTSMPPLQKL